MRIGLEDLDDLAQGCAILGSGGGGDVEPAIAQVTASIATHGPVEVVDLDDLADDVLVMPIAGWGAPTVGIEKLGSGREAEVLRRAVERWHGSEVGALMAGEIGGGNGVAPVAFAASMGLPLVDADGMGRAFPEGPQVAMHVAGLPAAPAFLADEHGNVATIEPVDGDWYERLARTVTVAFGGSAWGADFVMTAAPALARRLPVLTLGSGPSNSLRGAAALTGMNDVLVADIGGTSTDVGALVHGFPRESAAGVTIGGVVTNFRMPDVVSVTAGGGTLVGPDSSLGLESVGRRLTSEALVFGPGRPRRRSDAPGRGRGGPGPRGRRRAIDRRRPPGGAAGPPCLGRARQRAVDAGADPARLETVWIDEVPLAYLDRPVSRLRAKVAGPPA